MLSSRRTRATADCFHCGLPVPEPGARFCCAGCEAVSHAITAQGLDNYYRLRGSAAAERASPAPSDDFTLYDDPEVQARFVRRIGEGVLEADLILEGIRCPACSWLVEQVAARHAGVREASVNYATRRARIA